MVSIGDIIRITCNMLLGVSDPYVNVFHCQWFGVDGLSDDMAMDQIAEDMDFGYLKLFAHMSTSLNFVDIQGQNLTQGRLLPTKAWPTLTTGQSLGHLLPPQICAYNFYRTVRPKTRASVYLPGMTEDDNASSGIVSSALQASMQDFGDYALSGFAKVVQHLIYGAYNRPLDRFTPVNAAIVASAWKTQRRRGRGVEL